VGELDPTKKWDWIGTIETSKGSYVDVINIDPDMVSLEDVATSLSKICRFNGHLPSHYSVAEHSIWVANWLRDQGCSPQVVLTGLLHDACEAYVGDMMRPLKRLPEMVAVFKPIEENAMSAVQKKLGGLYPHPDIVHVADREAYEWEAANIRTGLIEGRSADSIRDLFLYKYKQILEDHNRYQGVETVTYPHLGFRDEEVHDMGDPRSYVLDTAKELVNGERNTTYGDPIDDFRRTAAYWSIHIKAVLQRKLLSLGMEMSETMEAVFDNLLDPHDVAIMMMQLKHSRLGWSPYKEDHWVDAAGYAACGYDCTIRE